MNDSEASRPPSLFLGVKKRRWPLFWRTLAYIATPARQMARRAIVSLSVVYISVAKFVISQVFLLMGFWGLNNELGCQPDGSFSLYKSKYDRWVPYRFFRITIPLGVFTFVQVKVLDIAWQVALVASLSWRVFADYVATKMTEAPVAYVTFWIIFLHKEPTLTSTYRLAREFCLYTGTRSPVASTFMLLTAIFVVAFPTSVNSMTGYVTASQSLIEVEGGNMVPFENFRKVSYVIHDGSRVNLTDEYKVVDTTYDPLISDDPWYLQSDCKISEEFYKNCTILGPCRVYGFNGNQSTETKWMGRPLESEFESFPITELNEIKLPAPPLKISAFYIYSPLPSVPLGPYGYNWKDPVSNSYPFRDFLRQRWVYEDKLYSMKDMRGDCKPRLSQEYQWGFSFIQLVIMLMVLLVWATGLYTMRSNAQHHLPLKDEPEVPRGWRAIVELSRATERELPLDTDLTNMTDREAKLKIRKHLRGGRISLNARLTNPSYSVWSGFLAWARKKKW